MYRCTGGTTFSGSHPDVHTDGALERRSWAAHASDRPDTRSDDTGHGYSAVQERPLPALLTRKSAASVPHSRSVVSNHTSFVIGSMCGTSALGAWHQKPGLTMLCDMTCGIQDGRIIQCTQVPVEPDAMLTRQL